MRLSKAGTRFLVFVVTSLGFFGMIAALMAYAVPEENSDILKILVGFVGGAFVTIVSFYFGDSDGRSGTAQ